MKKLLIYIPSYNRYELLVRQLTVLTKSIDAGHLHNIRIIVSDNASPDERYLNLSNLFPQNYLEVRRNQVNVGSVANVIHGFEQLGHDYVWILSDDDEIQPNTLEIISTEVGRGEHDFYYLKNAIKGDHLVEDGEVLHTQEEFLRRFSSIAMMGLISANIYPVRINKYIEYFFLYGYTLFPHVAGVFMFMKNEQFSLKCLGGNLIEWKPNRNSYSHIYEMALTNVLFLAELIQDKRNHDLYISKHLSDFGVSHFFPYAIRSPYNFKKAWAQVGLGRLLMVGLHYAVWHGRAHILRLVKSVFPKASAWYREYKAKK